MSLPVPTQLGQCNTLIASRKRPDGYRRARVPVRTLPAVAAGTAGKPFRYTRLDYEGNVARQAVCLLPDIAGAEEFALAQFSLPGMVVLQNCGGQQDGGGGGVQVQGGSACCVEEGLCELPGIGVEVCPTGMSKSEDGETCICDNGGLEEANCWLPGDEGECDSDFEECEEEEEEDDDEEEDGDGDGDGNPVPPVFSPNDVFQVMDTLPNCTAPKSDGERAWCTGVVPDSIRLVRTQEALDSIATRGPECEALADAGRLLLDMDRLKYFDLAGFEFSHPDSTFEAGAPINGHWVVIADKFVDKLYKRTDWPYDLQWILAHELDHHLGELHIGALYDRTTNTVKCAGRGIP